MTDQVNEAVQYRKKPVVIEAMQLAADPSYEFNDALHGFMAGCDWCSDRDGIQIETLEGTMHASPGDWIIKGVKGEFYPCKPDIFAATYEPAAHPSRGVVDDWTAADNGDYDRSIHANPSAEAWADFFVATFPKQAHLRDLMRGWFANAMMAMHDHLHYKAQAAALPAAPSVPEDGDTFAAISAEMREVVNGYDFNRDDDLSEWANRIDALAANLARQLAEAKADTAKWKSLSDAAQIGINVQHKREVRLQSQLAEATRRLGEVEAALSDLLLHVDGETCQHEETHRGGAIWTICDGCGKQWADDRGGFKPHEDAPAVARARSALTKEPTK